jgi:hypothetical protein
MATCDAHILYRLVLAPEFVVFHLSNDFRKKSNSFLSDLWRTLEMVKSYCS